MSKIEFVSYDGSYPNLCRGTLKVSIYGVGYSFGDCDDSVDFPAFWKSGGCLKSDYSGAIEDDWLIAEYSLEEFPDWIRVLLPDLIKLMNDNVEKGCCGGCI